MHHLVLHLHYHALLNCLALCISSCRMSDVSLYQGDMATAEERLRAALVMDPSNPLAKAMIDSIEVRKNPLKFEE